MPKPCDHDSRPLYELLIEPLREKARELGYALGVHGTLKRDIDLIACPWTAEAVPAHDLADALLGVAGNVHGIAFLSPPEDKLYQRAGCPGYKPHGRLCWTIHLGGGPYIDLSVMPRTDPPEAHYYHDDDGTWHPLHGAPERQFAALRRTGLFLQPGEPARETVAE